MTTTTKKPSKLRLAVKEVQKLLTKLPDQRRIPKTSQGKTTELGICQFIAALLKINEDVPKVRRLNDETIKRALVAEFPTAKSVKRLEAGKISIGYWRTLYNLGHLTQGNKPKTKSKQYNEKGEVINPRSGKPVE